MNNDNIEQANLQEIEEKEQENIAQEEKKKNHKITDVISAIILVFLTLICGFLIYGRIVYSDVYAISGESMTVRENDNPLGATSSLYLDGKIVFIDKNLPVERNKVAIINTANKNHPLIKRIIGLGGDKIWCEDGYLFVLEKGKDEPYIIKEADGSPLPVIDEMHLGNLKDTNAENPYIIADGCIYYMGDNRNHSTDSRYNGECSANYIEGMVKGFVPDWYIFILKIKGLENKAIH